MWCLWAVPHTILHLKAKSCDYVNNLVAWLAFICLYVNDFVTWLTFICLYVNDLITWLTFICLNLKLHDRLPWHFDQPCSSVVTLSVCQEVVMNGTMRWQHRRICRSSFYAIWSLLCLKVDEINDNSFGASIITSMFWNYSFLSVCLLILSLVKWYGFALFTPVCVAVKSHMHQTTCFSVLSSLYVKSFKNLFDLSCST
jgi:hypothetical protein